jgi:hypothetical protein
MKRRTLPPAGASPASAAAGCLKRAAVLACGALHLVSWLLGGVEVMLACYYLGHDVSLRQGIVLESLS